MDDIRDIYWKQLRTHLGGIAYQLTRVQLASFRATECWSPAVNAYGCRNSIILCVDLAGVETSAIQISVEVRRVLIRGHRKSPEPDSASGLPLQVLALEIEYGPFEREVMLPLDVDPQRVKAEQRNGVLWIDLHLLLPEPPSPPLP